MSNNNIDKNKAISVENEINDENLTEVAGGIDLTSNKMAICANCRAIVPKVGLELPGANAFVCPRCGGKQFTPASRSYNGGSANQGR